MNEKLIIEEIRSWINPPTKWMHGVALKGYGADCIQFLVALAKVFKWLPDDFKTIKYDRDFALHNADSILLKEIENYCIRLEDRDFQVGDILLFNFGRCASHAGIYIGDGKMVHAHIRAGVEEIDVNRIMDKFVSVWRFKGD